MHDFIMGAFDHPMMKWLFWLLFVGVFIYKAAFEVTWTSTSSKIPEEDEPEICIWRQRRTDDEDE